MAQEEWCSIPFDLIVEHRQNYTRAVSPFTGRLCAELFGGSDVSKGVARGFLLESTLSEDPCCITFQAGSMRGLKAGLCF